MERKKKGKISNSCRKKWHGWLQKYLLLLKKPIKLIDQAG
jgi:hypothetical protein